MPIDLPPLPYADSALEPAITAGTISYHYGKHHRTYVENVNKLVAGTDLAECSLEEIIAAAAAAPTPGLFNNAAQIWNHTFFWESMKPAGGGAPGPATTAALEAAFGSVEAFLEKFLAASLARFGSGWAWLVRTADGVAITTTANAETPLTTEAKPLLTVDLWEHAYYLDYQNRRADFVKAYFGSLVNWDRVEALLVD